MKKAYKSLYMEASEKVEELELSLKELDAMILDKSMMHHSRIDELQDRLDSIASNNVMLRDKVNRYRVISFMLGMGLLAQYCLFRFY